MHDDTMVNVLFGDGSGGENKEYPAISFVWDMNIHPVAFRVTKPYVEPKKPRELWIDFRCDGTLPLVYGSEVKSSGGIMGFVMHVREVLE